ncbi:DUF4276 family protein [Desulfobacterales bacterium HSG2]|nr:DUF4276 family protein [Desulfobacterales bacterium HSG2]
MTLLKLQLIVEGHSEAECLSGLVVRYLQEQGIYDVIPAPVINTKGCTKLKARYQKERHLGIEYFVNLSFKRNPDAILILLDADDECLEKRGRDKKSALGPRLLERAFTHSRGIPVRVAVANRQFEAWLVAGWPDIVRQTAPPNPDRITQHDRENAEKSVGHAGKIRDALGRKYSKTSDMPKMVKHLPFKGEVLKFAPSYARFLRVVKDLVTAARKFEKGDKHGLIIPTNYLPD